MEQQIVPAEKEAALGIPLDEKLFAAYGRWKDAAAERIIDGVLEQLASADPAFAEGRGTHVRLLATRKPLIAPGFNRVIYLSRGLLGSVAYENELAFVLAMQLALVKDHAVARNFASLQGEEVGERLVTLPTTPSMDQRDYLAGEWFEPGGLFDFGAIAYLKAQQEGIQLLHKAKYDPRGAVSLTQRWIAPPLSRDMMRAIGKILPEPEERLAEAREEVAKLSPLRDPIVKSEAFDELQSRLQVKKAKLRKKPPTKGQ